ncbi:MAG: amidohydrolase family protein [Anaerolineae bacterium]|nr:amidohydrolase family protein [Anaerolineae bacterium]
MAERLIIDVHTHIGSWPFPGRYQGGDVCLNLELMQRSGIALSILSSTRAIVNNMEAGNAELAGVLARYANLRGYVVVNPRRLADSLHEVDRYAARPGFVGVKIHPHYCQTSIGSQPMVALFAELAERGRPVLIHTWGESEVGALVDLAARHPGLPIIAGHAGADAWRPLVEVAPRLPNLYLEFCYSVPLRERIERAVAATDGRQVLFGSDATLFDPAYGLAAYNAAPMTAEQRERVMSLNALALFHLSQPAP